MVSIWIKKKVMLLIIRKKGVLILLINGKEDWACVLLSFFDWLNDKCVWSCLKFHRYTTFFYTCQLLFHTQHDFQQVSRTVRTGATVYWRTTLPPVCVSPDLLETTAPTWSVRDSAVGMGSALSPPVPLPPSVGVTTALEARPVTGAWQTLLGPSVRDVRQDTLDTTQHAAPFVCMAMLQN